MIKGRLSASVEMERLKKLRRIAEDRKKTMTQLIEEWIDTMSDVAHQNE